MLKKLSIILEGEGNISYNYHYPLMVNLYEAMELIDKDKAKWIHDKGVSIDNKKIKLFNFCLDFNKNVDYNVNHVAIKGFNQIKLILSGDEKILNLIIKGLVKKGNITLGSCILYIVNIEESKKVRYENVMLYKVRTPIIESLYQDGTVYINPYQQEWYKAIANNLKRKYKAVYNEEYTDEIYFDIENILNIKKKYITNIKNKGYVIGYTDFEIFIEATPKMQKVIYNLGIGQNTSMGMGAISYVKGWKENE